MLACLPSDACTCRYRILSLGLLLFVGYPRCPQETVNQVSEAAQRIGAHVKLDARRQLPSMPYIGALRAGASGRRL